MEVLVTFDSAMTLNDNGFVAFLEVVRTDEEFAEYMDAIGILTLNRADSDENVRCISSLRGGTRQGGR